MNEKTLTVFTPTYNRAHTLPRLYQSLLRQTDKDFCWIVVDDGSDDDTSDLIRGWIGDRKIAICYFRQKNQGKPSAHNKGVELAQTELFTCVDSDDYLTEDAVCMIHQAWKKAKAAGCIGILGYREREREGRREPLTGCTNPKIKAATLRAFYDHGLYGDTILVYQTKYLRKHPFPKFRNEKFIPEAYLYDQLDQEGKLYLLRKAIYVCEYQPDGYTSNMASLLYRNPKGYFCYIEQRLRYDTNPKQKFLDSVRYTGMAIAHRKRSIIRHAVYPMYTVFALIPGWLFYMMRYRGVS